jgi:hypothetical protein
MKQLRGTALRHAALLGAAVGLAAILGDSRAVAQAQGPASAAPGISQNRAGEDGTQLGGLPRTGPATRSHNPWLSPVTLILLPLVLARRLHRRYQTRRYGHPLAKTVYDYPVALFAILTVYAVVVHIHASDWTNLALGLGVGAALAMPAWQLEHRRLDRAIDRDRRQMSPDPMSWRGVVLGLAGVVFLEAEAGRYFAGIGMGIGLALLVDCVLARSYIARLERDGHGPIVVVKRTGDGA